MILILKPEVSQESPELEAILRSIGVCPGGRPSHSVGRRDPDPTRILDIARVSTQAVIAGANVLLVDFRPAPDGALCDGPQALLVRDLPCYLEDVRIAREAYERRRELAAKN